jgi:hypothetical protein
LLPFFRLVERGEHGPEFRGDGRGAAQRARLFSPFGPTLGDERVRNFESIARRSAGFATRVNVASRMRIAFLERSERSAAITVAR